MTEGRLYLAGGAVAFIGLSALVIAGTGRIGALVLLGGLVTLGVAWGRGRRRAALVELEIEDQHLHPVPVLDAPKGTYNLISGMTVKVHNRQDEPIGIRIDTLLYYRTIWKWDRPVTEAEPEPLLAPSVIAARTTKSFFVRNRTRLPAEIDELTPSHFVKLIVETSELGKRVYRAFLGERFKLQKEWVPAPQPRAHRFGEEEAPLLPFSDRPPARTIDSPSLGARIVSTLASVAARRRRSEVVRVHPLRESDDSLEGLIEELDQELEEERESTTQA